MMLWLLASCAQIVAPSGGGKDETPPKVLRMYPQNKTTHFNAPKLFVQFDEFIVLNNPSDQIIISPPLDQKPEFIIDHKKVVVDFKKQTLKSNTTYTVNFGNAVGDLHENNIVQNLTYVFCTGDVLDTLYVAGICSNAFTNKPEKGMLVGLYPAKEFTDSTIYKFKPVYFTRSKPNGSFSIENIPDQPFKIVSFGDENNNLKYDPNELIAFTSQEVHPADTNLGVIRLNAYLPDPYPEGKIIDTFSRVAGKFSLVAYKLKDKSVIWTGLSPTIIWSDPAKNHLDTLTFFSGKNDTLISFGYRMSDTIYPITISTKKSNKPQALAYILKKSPENNDSLTFLFNHPINKTDTSGILLKEDSLPIRDYKITVSKDGRQAMLSYAWKESMRYNLQIQDSSFYDISGRPTGSPFKYAWNTKALKDYSSLRLNFINKDTNQIIFQLLNEQESAVIKEVKFTGDTMIYMDFMPPGSYKIKFIYDTNKDGNWSNGNYLKHLAPEKVSYYSENIILRSYWDIEQVIDLSILDK